MSTSYEQKVSDTTINYDTALSSGMSKMNVSTDDVDGSTMLITLSCCVNCGKEGSSDNMNTCNKCKSVKYCNAACKKKHRKKHKKKCEERVAELHDEALFKDPPPPDECPICLLILPEEGQSTFQTCCGKVICPCYDKRENRVVSILQNTFTIIRQRRDEKINKIGSWWTCSCNVQLWMLHKGRRSTGLGKG